jgi:hypothetical protein
MANEPHYRDQSKLDYLPAFNDETVVRIDRAALAAAAVVGLFGILYFSLAPAAMSTDVTISSVQQDGYICKMIASITRTVTPFSDEQGLTRGVLSFENSKAIKSDANARLAALAVSSEFDKLVLKNPMPDALIRPWLFQFLEAFVLGSDALVYDNSHFDKYDDCLATARAQTTCRMKNDVEFPGYSPGPAVFGAPTSTVCKTSIYCFSLNDKATITGPFDVHVNRTLLADPAVGKCNDKANVLTCSNINSNCQSLKQFLAGYENIVRKIAYTPELLCKPFLTNPPYICTRAVPPSVPSILSQSFAFMTTALAVVKAALFLAVKMRHSHGTIQPEVSDSELQQSTTVVRTEMPPSTMDSTADAASVSAKTEP